MEWEWASAREVAETILEELFGDDAGRACGSPGPPDPAQGELELTGFQVAAVHRARRILAERGGVLIADGVGLGKTYIGLALLREELADGGRALVAVPAALMPMWKTALRGLGRVAQRVDTVSHTRLSRGSFRGDPAGYAVVVVDEAHRFRNPRARRYAALARLCEDARVVLLTATPFNNRFGDLHHLLRLFSRDDGFRDLGIPGLAAAFDAAERAERVERAEDGAAGRAGGARERREDGQEIRRVVQAVMVRRTRDVVRNALPTRGGVGFPTRGPPRLVRYADPALTRLARSIYRLRLPMYDMVVPAGPGGGRADAGVAGDRGVGGEGAGGPAPSPGATGGTSALVRLGLLKRLDSSRAALRRSLAGQVRFARAFLDAADGGRLLRPADLAGFGVGDGDADQLLLVDVVAAEATPDVDLRRLSEVVRRDLRRLRAIRRVLGPARTPDPKLRALLRLHRELSPEKLLVFTEYRDTAESLWTALALCARVGRIDGSGAWLGARPAGRGTVVGRFAPRANGRRIPPDRERVDVLVATDVLAEGLNLQDARHVVSYDLPWNPVRLLQRIGRVDRLGSPHEEVRLHLFVPDRGVDALIGLTRALRSKLRGMGRTVGVEAADRELARMVGLSGQRPGALREDVAALERLRLLWEQSPRAGGRYPYAANGPPHGVGLRPESGSGNGETPAAPTHPPRCQVARSLAAGPTVALVGWGASRWLMTWDPARGGGAAALRDAGHSAVAPLSAALGPAVRPDGEHGPPTRPTEDDEREAPAGPGESAHSEPPIDTRLAALERAIREHFRARQASVHAPTGLAPTSSAARLARALRRAITRDRSRTARLTARADRVLERLSHPLPAAVEADARLLLNDLGGAGRGPSLEDLVADLEALLGPDPDTRRREDDTRESHPAAAGSGRRAQPPTPARSTRLIAVLFGPGSAGSGAVDDGSRPR